MPRKPKEIQGTTESVEWPKDSQHPYLGTCGHCNRRLFANGWCDYCHAYPSNISPVRTDERGHRIDASGWCHECRAFVASRWEVEDGRWVDTHRTDKLLPVDENKRRMNFVMDCIGRGDKAALLVWAKKRERIEPGIGWEETVKALEQASEHGPEEEVPF